MGGREEGVGDFCLHFKHPVVGKFTYWLVAACLNGIIWLSSILYLCTHWLLHMTWFLYPPDQQSAHHLFAKKCFRQFFFIFVTKISDYYFVFCYFSNQIISFRVSHMETTWPRGALWEEGRSTTIWEKRNSAVSV